MQDQFTSARLKIAHSEKLIADLKAIVETLEESCVPDIRRDAASNGYMVYYELPNATEVMTHLSPATGDVIHNLKSALDHAWIGAYKRFDLTESGHTKFPVGDDLVKLLGMMKPLASKSLDLYNLVLSEIKPHKNGNYELWSIHRLDIQDKHQLVLPLMSNVGVDGLSVRDDKGELHNGGTWGFTYENGFHIDFHPTWEILSTGKLVVSVLFAEDIPYSHQRIVETLGIFSRTVTNTVNRLEGVR